MRYSEILYKIQVKFTIAYPDENPKMLFSLLLASLSGAGAGFV
jgi:hypothetical protein